MIFINNEKCIKFKIANPLFSGNLNQSPEQSLMKEKIKIETAECLEISDKKHFISEPTR